MRTYHIFSGEHNGVTVMRAIENETLKEEDGKVEDFFLHNTTNIHDCGEIEVEGAAEDMLDDNFSVMS
jgi:hypothetical protein